MMADEIKKRRKAAGLTQAAAARSLGVGQSMFSRWENGRATPSAGQIDAMRSALADSPSLATPDVVVSPTSEEPNGSARVRAPLDAGSTDSAAPPFPAIELPNEDERLFQNSTTAIILGDALDVLRGIPDQSANLIFLDPPYNIGKRFGESHDKWPTDEAYVEWCKEWMEECIRILTRNGSLYLMSSTQGMPHLDIWLRKHLTTLSRIIWHYDSSGVQARKYFGSLYEPILHCVANIKDYTFNANNILVEAKTGAKRKLIDYRKTVPTVYNSQKVPGNVWYFPRVRYRMDEYEEHPSQKPESLLERVIGASSNPGDVVLDPFAGTFTTGAVAQRLGRRFIGIERQLQYLKIGLRRLGMSSNLDGEDLAPPKKNYVRRNGTASPTAAPQGGQTEIFVGSDD